MPDGIPNTSGDTQWKQRLNGVTDWNNSSFCPLVSQTSCLTKLNPSWCQAFRPISLLFCLVVFFYLFLLSFCLDPHPLIGSLGTDINYLFLASGERCAVEQEEGLEPEKQHAKTKMEMDREQGRGEKPSKTEIVKQKWGWMWKKDPETPNKDSLLGECARPTVCWGKKCCEAERVH